MLLSCEPLLSLISYMCEDQFDTTHGEYYPVLMLLIFIRMLSIYVTRRRSCSKPLGACTSTKPLLLHSFSCCSIHKFLDPK